MAGLRVVRGPDWKWTDQDGGIGTCGTLTGNKASPGWVSVLWDGGRKNDYRAGAEDKCDLLLLDNGPSGVKHPGVQCDSCTENNVRGLRWKCADCPDYDLCTECYGNDRHDMNHKFVRIDTPSSDRANVGKRQNAVKLQSRGLYKGAQVVRGEDWDKGNQDGGVGNVGTITQVGYVSEEIAKSAVKVEWASDSDAGYVYRLGLGGNVDVKCKTAAVGWGYYRDHLPALRDVKKVTDRTLKTAESSGEDLGRLFAELLTGSLLGMSSALEGRKREETMQRFKAGDVVRVSDDVGKVERLQKGHGGFNFLMIPILGERGIVLGVDSDGDVKVKFGAIDWTLNPAILTKVAVQQQQQRQAEVRTLPSSKTCPFKAGDRVVIGKDEATVRRLQQGHGGWGEPMRKFVGTGAVGIVRNVDDDNDVLVAFGDKQFLLNPEVCSAPPKKAKLQNVTSDTKLKVGDRVTMDKDLDFVKRNQDGHGGWDPAMRKAAVTVGVVQKIDSDGDLEVEFEGKKWTFNPECLHRADSGTLQRKKDKNVNKSENEELSAKTGVCPFSVGDHVRLDKDVDFVKRLQKGHGGWTDDMKKVMTKVGRVLLVDGDGDIKVLFDGQEWTLNPDVCHKAAPHEVLSRDVRAKVKDKDVNVSSPTVSCPFKAGDKVQTISDMSKFQNLQKGHGGWNVAMRSLPTQIGRVVEVDGDGDVKIDFGGTKWTLNPEVCQKYDKSQVNRTVSRDQSDYENVALRPPRKEPTPSASRNMKFTVDEQVKINMTADRLRVLQRGHGGWSDNMSKIIGQVGVIEKIDADGDLRVRFPQGVFTFNSEACTSLDSVKNKASAAPPPPPKPKRPLSSQNSFSFRPGDCVKIPLDIEMVTKLQRGHGGWNAAMGLALGKVGVIHTVQPSGDLDVNYGDNCWTFNPDVFVKVEADAQTARRRSKDANSAAGRDRVTMTSYQCPICLTEGIGVVFNCGHGTCEECSKSIDKCHMCRQPIALRTKMFLN